MDGAVVGIAPLVRTSRFGSERLELLGTAILVEPSGILYCHQEALTDLLKAILSMRKPLLFNGLLTDALETLHLKNSGRSPMAYSRSRPSASPWIPINCSWEKFSSTIASSWRSNLRRAQRRAEEFGTVQFEMISPDPASLEHSLAEVFRVEAASWKSRTGTALEIEGPLKHFFQIYAKSAAGNGTLRLAFLRINGKSVAAQLLVECANRLWVLKVGYDESYARCSPGILLMHRVLQYAFEKPYEALELLGANESWLHIWNPQVHMHESYRRYPYSPVPMVSLGLELSVVTAKKIRTLMIRKKLKGFWQELGKKARSRMLPTSQEPAH